VIAARRTCRIDRLLVQQAPDDDAAPGLTRLGIGRAQLVGNTLAVRAQADVVDPAETVQIISANRCGHGVNRLYCP
jgi:hypothetical protein